jgi:hypothetical protein
MEGGLPVAHIGDLVACPGGGWIITGASTFMDSFRPAIGSTTEGFMTLDKRDPKLSNEAKTLIMKREMLRGTATGTVNVVMTDGTAHSSNAITGIGDYGNISAQPVTLNQAFHIDALDDFTADPGETFTVAIANDQSYSEASAYENVTHDTSAVTTTIIDDSDTTTLTLNGDTAVAEGSSASHTLSVDHAPESDLIVEVTIGHIDTDNSDFDPSLNYVQNITIPQGSTTASFTIDNFDDSHYEGDEEYKVTITNTSGGSYENLVVDSSQDEVSTTITDNDAKPALSIDDVTVNEDDATMTFTVSMTGTAQADVTFDYASSDDTPLSAEAGKDYSAVSGQGTIASGSTSTTITVPILDD